MDLLHLVDRLEELVGSAQKMPIGSRAIVDRRRILDIVDQMRVAVPQEVREAQEIVNNRDEIFREAEEEARLIVARAEERASRLVEQHELTIAARTRAEEIARDTEARIEDRVAEANDEIQQRVQDSRRVADQQMEAADEYARELLTRLEGQLQAFVRSVQSGISQLQAPSTPTSSAQPAPAVPAFDPSEEEAAIAISDPVDVDPGDTEDGLEDLLQRPSFDDVPEPPPAEPGIIDDYSMPQLDDEPSAPAAWARPATDDADDEDKEDDEDDDGERPRGA
jgi:vacuolar-type H+-ATPase subunit H